MPWINNEAKAVLAKLNSGPDGNTHLYVTDANSSARKVVANFKDPEQQVLDTVYPNIVVEYAGLNRAPEREHRGHDIPLPYIPEDFQSQAPIPYLDPVTGVLDPAWDPANHNSGPIIAMDMPIPYDMDFQITVNSRYRNHLEQLERTLAGIDYFPTRFGYLVIPQDNTVRSLFLEGGPEYTSTPADRNDKRLFQLVYLIRVATELNILQVRNVQDYVNSVSLTLSQLPNS